MSEKDGVKFETDVIGTQHQEPGTAEIQTTPVFFPVSEIKLILMSICTFGIYQIYWHYKNWQLIKECEKLNINPTGRAIFAIFFCYSLFKKILERAKSLGLTESEKPGLLTTGYIIFLMLRPSGFLWFVNLLSVFFLLPVQSASNAVNNLLVPGHNKNSRFRIVNLLFIVVGGIFLLMLIIEPFLLPPPE